MSTKTYKVIPMFKDFKNGKDIALDGFDIIGVDEAMRYAKHLMEHGLDVEVIAETKYTVFDSRDKK